MTRASSSSCYLLNREWDSLPLTVVFLILDKLLEPADHGRFAAICRQYHSLAKDYNRANRHTGQLNKDLLPPPTLLIYKGDERTMVSVSEGKIYNNVELPALPCSWSCYGCGHGWWAAVERTAEGVTMELQNPFRNPSTSNSIRLPFLIRSSEIGKVRLSGDPALIPDSYVVAAVLSVSVFGLLAFIRARQQHWTYIQVPTSLACNDAIFYKSQIYAIGYYGEILSVNLDSSSSNSVPEAKLLTPSGSHIEPVYLVESSKGDLLYIETVESVPLRVDGFKVYKVVFSDEDGSVIEQLLETSGIGDEALFLEDNHAVSFSVSNFPKCQRNSIYCSSNFKLRSRDGMRTFVFNLEDKTITEPYPLNTMQSYALQRHWIMPSLNRFY